MLSFFPPPQDTVRCCLEKGETELHALLSARSQVSARATIARMGQQHSRLYLLRSGWAAQLRYMADGHAQYCAILLPGDLIGADSMILDRQTEEVVAITQCELDTAEQAKIWQAANRQPDLAARIMWQLGEDGRRLRNWLVAMSQGDAEKRVALLLLDIRARLIRAGQLDLDRRDMPFPLTQQMMADTLGLTSVHINRVLRKLRDDGLATLRGGRAIMRVAALARLAEPLLDAEERRAPEFGLKGAAVFV